MNGLGKMPDRNPHTGAALRSRNATDMYREGFDRIFSKKREEEERVFCVACGRDQFQECPRSACIRKTHEIRP
jgi:hypothetical protein